MTSETTSADAARRRGRIIAVVVAGVVLLLAAAVCIGLFLPTLRSPDDDSVEAGFARDMSTHHGQAVEMSMLAVQRADSAAIRTVALDMGLTQQAQIGMMRAWLRQWNLSPTGTGTRMAWMRDDADMQHADMSSPAPARGARMPGMATAEEIRRLRTLRGPAFDTLFADLMIRHHTGGIQMVDAVLRLDPDAQVRELAESMKLGQQSEINALNDIKARLNANP